MDMNVEISVRRGEVALWGWNTEFSRKINAYMGEHPESGAIKDPNCLFNKLRAAQRELVHVVSKFIGDDAIEPFAITIKVEGHEKIYPPPGTNCLY